MQFKRHQREQLEKSWGAQSWFYQYSGQSIRDIVGRAYGIQSCTPRERALSQEYLTLALSIFAHKIGAEKSHVVHALLTNSVRGLRDAVWYKGGDPNDYPSEKEIAENWEAAFREVSFTS